MGEVTVQFHLIVKNGIGVTLIQEREGVGEKYESRSQRPCTYAMRHCGSCWTFPAALTILHVLNIFPMIEAMSWLMPWAF